MPRILELNDEEKESISGGEGEVLEEFNCINSYTYFIDEGPCANTTNSTRYKCIPKEENRLSIYSAYVTLFLVGVAVIVFVYVGTLACLKRIGGISAIKPVIKKEQ